VACQSGAPAHPTAEGRSARHEAASGLWFVGGGRAGSGVCEVASSRWRAPRLASGCARLHERNDSVLSSRLSRAQRGELPQAPWRPVRQAQGKPREGRLRETVVIGVASSRWRAPRLASGCARFHERNDKQWGSQRITSTCTSPASRSHTWSAVSATNPSRLARPKQARSASERPSGWV